MKILIVGLVKNSQLARLKEEGQKRGHIVNGCYVKNLIVQASNDVFLPSLLNDDLEKYNLVYLWALGKRSWEWYVACDYLHQKKGTIVVNYKTIDPEYKLYSTVASTYYKLFKEKILFPKSTIVFSSNFIKEAIKGYSFPVVVKTVRGRQGRGVYKVENINALIELSRELEQLKRGFIIREFIPNDGDIRVFTVGYKAIGAMKRTPSKKEEFRSNISLGGKGEKYDLESSPKVRNIAERVAKLTRTQIAGVDIMIHKQTNDPYVLEVNPGPQFTGFEKYTGVNAASEIINYFEKLHSENN